MTHLLLSLAWLSCLILAGGALAMGSTINAAVLAAIAVVAALAARSFGTVSAIDVHHRTEYHHHFHDPVHIEHDHRSQP